MAFVDHTVIVFKNGKYIPGDSFWDENGKYIKLCPFEYGRDGDIYEIAGGIDIQKDMKWYCSEAHAYYQRDGAPFKIKRFSLYRLKERIKWFFRCMSEPEYTQKIGVWKNNEDEIYIYRNDLEQSNVSFYSNGSDTYVILGGYGHYGNVYTHFMGRGYGDEFEHKLASEAFDWCCRCVLLSISETIADSCEAEDELLKSLQWAFRDRYR